MGESEQRLRAIVETTVDAIITIDERGVIESANASTESIFGFTPQELIGRPVTLLMPSPYREEHGEYLRRYLATGQAKVIGTGRDVVGQRKDGRLIPIHLSLSEVSLARGRMFTAIVHDVTERRRLERQVLEASTLEQRRIGLELHDGVCQNLVGAALGMSVLAKRLSGEWPAAAAEAEMIAELVRQTAEQARNLAHGLSPLDVAADGLAPALQKLATQITELARVTCTFRNDGHDAVNDGHSATHLYRIAQEAVSNAIRHGKAENIEIRLARDAQRVVLSVRDDGRGFGEQRGEGMGLQTMAYRAHMIGGVLSIESAPGGGTIVTCAFHEVRPESRGVERSAGGNGKHARRSPVGPLVRPGASGKRAKRVSLGPSAS